MNWIDIKARNKFSEKELVEIFDIVIGEVQSIGFKRDEAICFLCDPKYNFMGYPKDGWYSKLKVWFEDKGLNIDDEISNKGIIEYYKSN